MRKIMAFAAAATVTAIVAAPVATAAINAQMYPHVNFLAKGTTIVTHKVTADGVFKANVNTPIRPGQKYEVEIVSGGLGTVESGTEDFVAQRNNRVVFDVEIPVEHDEARVTLINPAGNIVAEWDIDTDAN